ncbi:ABC-2 type transport system permease protein [Propionicimonas paludicola]|uniref:ABC-2 type transport system permease protein n=1 Tax=Propionicimonas paludicola TaxID=185243 RepID=A0A2A9CQY2_9ACTN|nr:ABC transporter permease [Propionicimonas paludicola]PFG16022.1 ABC-2 type transport system permease protein [Propionicimonas paludicola]
MSGKRIRLLIWKEFLQLRRDPMLIRLLMLMPVLQLILFGYVVAVDIRNLSTAVVDLDHSATSQKLEAAFTGSGYFRIVSHPASENELRPLLDRGTVTVAIVIPEGTEDRLITGQTAPVGIVVDGSDSQISAVGSGYASQIIAGFNAELRDAAGVSLSPPGVDARIRVMFNPTMDPVNTMIPGLIAVIMMISLMAILSQAVVKERESGTLEQMFVTPIKAEEYLIGKVTPYAVLATAQMLVVAVVGMLWFRVPFSGNVWVVLTGLALFMLTNIGMGLFVSLVSRTRQQAQQAMAFLMIPTMILSGFIFPIESMPDLIQPFTKLIPMTWALIVLRNSFVKGSDFAALTVPLVVLAGFAVVIFTAAVVATRRRISD